MTGADATLICRDCGSTFSFTEEERRSFPAHWQLTHQVAASSAGNSASHGKLERIAASAAQVSGAQPDMLVHSVHQLWAAGRGTIRYPLQSRGLLFGL